MIPIVLTEIFSIRLSITNPKPIVAITSKRKLLKCMSKNIPKFTRLNSKMISHIPLDKRNRLLAATSFLFLKERKADKPAKKTKVGAQK